MNNIELYNNIEERVRRNFYFARYYPIYGGEDLNNNEDAIRKEILHWMQIGEDSLQILDYKHDILEERLEEQLKKI